MQREIASHPLLGFLAIGQDTDYDHGAGGDDGGGTDDDDDGDDHREQKALAQLLDPSTLDDGLCPVGTVIKCDLEDFEFDEITGLEDFENWVMCQIPWQAQVTLTPTPNPNP